MQNWNQERKTWEQGNKATYILVHGPSLQKTQQVVWRCIYCIHQTLLTGSLAKGLGMRLAYLLPVPLFSCHNTWCWHFPVLSVLQKVYLILLCLTYTHIRFLHDRERPPEATANIRKLLTVHLKNLPLRRRLAAELGMTDVLQTLSSSFNEGFLNDVARLWP